MNFSKCVMQLIRCLNRIVYIEAANKLQIGGLSMKKIIRTLVTFGLAVSVIMTGARAFAQENTSAEFTYTGSNDSDYKGQSTVVI